MKIEEAQAKLEQARKEKKIIWDTKTLNKTPGRLMSNNDVLANIKKLHDERPRPKCRICGDELDNYISVLCVSCDEKQKQILKAERKEKEEARYQDRLENIEDWLLKIGIGKRYRACSFDTFQGGEKYVREGREFLKNRNYSIFLTGTYGCGKTHLAVGICRELLKLRKLPSIVFTTGAEMLLNIRKSYSNEDITEDEVIAGYTESDYLIIDDLGAEKTTEWAKTTLYIIVDRRDRELMPTIITSNLSLQEIESALDGRIASRIANSRVINMNMKDYRRRRKTG